MLRQIQLRLELMWILPHKGYSIFFINNRILRSSLGGAVIFIPLQQYIAPALYLMPCLPSLPTKEGGNKGIAAVVVVVEIFINNYLKREAFIMKIVKCACKWLEVDNGMLRHAFEPLEGSNIKMYELSPSSNIKEGVKS